MRLSSLTLALLSIFPLYPAEHYVATTGLAGNTGAIGSPWDIQTALNHPGAVQPGDTIWLRGGTYTGQFLSQLAGTLASPIIVRAYLGERPIIDCTAPPSPSTPMYSAITSVGNYVHFWGLEITNSYTTRIFANSQADCWEAQHCRAAAFDIFGVGNKLINNVIHDTGNGIGMWTPAVGAEMHGNIVYYMGWENEVRGNGHGAYLQNNTGTKLADDNVMFSGFHSGVHLYGGSGSFLRNVTLEGNAIFNNGLLALDPNGWGILVGGGVVAEDITVTANNLSIPTSFSRGSNMNPSYGLGTTRLTMTNNNSVGRGPLGYSTEPTASTITGNLLAGSDIPASVNPMTNTILASAPSYPIVRVRRNRYELTRGLITIFNGGLASTVSVDISSVLSVNDTYRIRDVQNYFGTPVLTGTYTGNAISIPMTGTTISTIVGTVPNAPVHTGTGFGVFILEKTGVAATRCLP